MPDPQRPVLPVAPDQPQDSKDAVEVFQSFIIDVRSRRMAIDEQWLRFHAAFLAQSTRQQFVGTFSHYIPAARRALNRAVTRLVEMLTPSNAFFEVYPLDEYGEQAGTKAEAVWRYLLFLTTKKIKMGSLLRQLGRTFYLYSRCISKFGIMQESQGPDKQPMWWPTLRAVDPFCFYAWPETVNTLEEAVVVFEDSFMPWETYREIAANKLSGVEMLDPDKLTAPTWPMSYTARLSRKTLTEPSSTQQGKSETDKQRQPVRFVELTEQWSRENSQWIKRWFVWNYEGGPRVVCKSPSPFGKHPYRWAQANQLPGEQHSVGMMDDLEPMQVALNDQVNMTMEGQAVAMCPPVAVDPNLVSRPNSIVFKPRARWFMDPNGAEVLNVPDTTKSGILGINMFLGFIDSFSGSNPLAEGQPTRGMPRAGFAVSSLLNLSLADIRDAARLIEDEVLTPNLGDLYRLSVEGLIPQDQLMAIPGAQPMSVLKVRPGDLGGDWEFQWVGAQQAQDYQVRAQRLVTFAGLLMKGLPVLQPALDRMGYTLDWLALLKRVWRDGLGERGADSIVRPMNPEEKQMMLMQMVAAAAANTGNPMPGAGGGGMPGASNPNSDEGVETAMGRQLSQGASAGPTGATAQ